jgi:hypothetical protein
MALDCGACQPIATLLRHILCDRQSHLELDVTVQNQTHSSINMWLLGTSDITLHFFTDHEAAQEAGGYAILSHTWGEEEVSFQEMRNADNVRLSSTSGKGMKKIKACCAQAAYDGFDYVWMDTCCIDKTNSTELSETINSMFNWYRSAIECYAYLSDVLIKPNDDPNLVSPGFLHSKWFTRGWTLQELIVPLSVVFFDSNWKKIGTKETLRRDISVITDIPTTVLLNCSEDKISVAQIMCWASKRQTTRVEDRAYSLMGLFNVNMPMIYGEGEKAFARLQNEIIKISDDQSLFTWTGRGDRRGPLSRYPEEFGGYGTIKPRTSLPNQSMVEFSMTNRGLRMYLHVTTLTDSRLVVAHLDCCFSTGECVGIYLDRISKNNFVRSSTTSLWSGDHATRMAQSKYS